MNKLLLSLLLSIPSFLSLQKQPSSLDSFIFSYIAFLYHKAREEVSKWPSMFSNDVLFLKTRLENGAYLKNSLDLK